MNNPELEKQQLRGRIWGGIILVGIGGVFLAKTLGVILPHWLFTWPIILILVGIYTLGKHGFNNLGGLIPLTIGLAFLAERIVPNIHIAHIAWPSLIILFGLYMIISPKGWRKKKLNAEWQNTSFGTSDKSTASSDMIDLDSVFSGVERTVISKNFKGGTVNCVFGGTEINLMQADIEGTVIIDINCVFGGVDLTVPASWKVQNEIAAILGGVEDKRTIHQDALETTKILVLKGTVVFGGVSVKGY